MIQSKVFSRYIKKIQAKLFNFFGRVNPIFYSVILNFFEILNKLKNKKRILIFTDSRGFEVTKPWNRKNPFSSYIGTLAYRYSCRIEICPEKFTSLIDFIDFYNQVDGASYDYTILHCSIVDFAPRPESSFEQMFNTKKSKLKKFLLYDFVDKKNRNPGVSYEGEPTYSFLNKEALTSIVLPSLQRMPNLIYIGVNRVLPDWDGIYWRKRPSNINEQLKLDALLLAEIKNTIDLSDLTDEQIKDYTSDNVHYTKEGFDYILSKLDSVLEQ